MIFFVQLQYVSGPVIVLLMWTCHLVAFTCAGRVLTSATCRAVVPPRCGRNSHQTAIHQSSLSYFLKVQPVRLEGGMCDRTYVNSLTEIELCNSRAAASLWPESSSRLPVSIVRQPSEVTRKSFIENFI